MKFKKINAILSLLTVTTIFLHAGYTVFSYLTFYYNPALKNIFSIPFMLLACLHAICAMGIVFFSSDGIKLDQYPGLNITTVVQRAAAVLIIPLLVLHLNTFKILTDCAAEGKTFLFFLVMFSQPVFFAAVFAHTAVSFSRALVTLGWLSSMKTKKKIDLISCIICAVFFALAVFAVIKGQLTMFMPSGGAR